MMGEIQVADSGASVQHPAQPKTRPKASGRASATSEPKPKRQKLNERGIPVTNWDNDKNDPNARKHVGEDPDGKGNKLAAS